MRLGYNTNGFAHHTLRDTLDILAEIGYECVALTLERDLLDPPDRTGVRRCVEHLKPLLAEFPLRPTIETGSRFILDRREKHQPTLISGSLQDRQRRIEFLKAAIDVAAAVGAECVSLWSGAADDKPYEEELFTRLTNSLSELLHHAFRQNVRLSFEPEPGMLVDTMAKFQALQSRTPHSHLGLTLDVGHACCLDDGIISQHVARWRDLLWNLHIEDMRCGVHEHLMLGEGDIDFGAVFAALRGIDYRGPVHVELSRHSHDAVETARKAYAFLQACL